MNFVTDAVQFPQGLLIISFGLSDSKSEPRHIFLRRHQIQLQSFQRAEAGAGALNGGCSNFLALRLQLCHGALESLTGSLKFTLAALNILSQGAKHLRLWRLLLLLCF